MMRHLRFASILLLSGLVACGGAGSSPPLARSDGPSLAAGAAVSAAPEISLLTPEALVFGPTGDLDISDFSGDDIAVLTPSGGLSRLVGTGSTGYSGDGGPALDAKLDSPTGMVFDPDGNLVFNDHDNGCIRRVNAAGVITRLAGTCGDLGFSGDGGPALKAHLNDPIGLAFDERGDLYFADEQNGRVRRIDTLGVITTIAGGGSLAPADNRPPTQVKLSHPSYVAFDGDGRLYFSDFGDNRVWMIDRAGALRLVAGDKRAGYAGDGGSAPDAELSWPTGLVFDADGNLYISDANNNVLRMVSPGGIITTIAGNGDAGSSGDGGPATEAQLNAPAGLAFDASGNLFIADQGNGLVRRVDSKTGVITTVAGS